MTPEQCTAEIQSGLIKPVYLLLGDEPYRRDQVMRVIKEVVLAGPGAAFNSDDYQAGEASAEDVLATAKTLPMLSPRRLVVLRNLDRWEAKDGKSEKGGRGGGSGPLDQLAEYLADPAPSCILVLTAAKLNARRKLLTTARQKGFFVACEQLGKNDLPGWITDAVRARGLSITTSTAALLAEVKGPELSPVEDAIERLCLYAGQGEITEEVLGEVMPVVRPATVWELLDAVGRRDVGSALALLAKVYDPKDRGLPLLGLLAWSTRQLLRFQAARASGATPEDAARRAGAPPFRAKLLERQLRQMGVVSLEQWLITLRDVDRDLKGASKRPARAVLEAALIELCSRAS